MAVKNHMSRLSMCVLVATCRRKSPKSPYPYRGDGLLFDPGCSTPKLRFVDSTRVYKIHTYVPVYAYAYIYINVLTFVCKYENQSDYNVWLTLSPLCVHIRNCSRMSNSDIEKDICQTKQQLYDFSSESPSLPNRSLPSDNSVQRIHTNSLKKL